MRFQTRLILCLAGLILGFALFVGALAWNEFFTEVKALTVNQAISMGRNLAHRSADLILTEDLLGLHDLARALKASDRHVAYVFIADAQGDPLAHTFERGFPPDLKRANIPERPDRGSIQLLETEKGLFRDVAVPVLGGRVGTVHVGLDEGEVRGHIRRAFRAIAFGAAITLLVGIALSVAAGQLLARPVTNLTTAIRNITSGRLDQQVEVRGPREIQQLARSFNEMAATVLRRTDELQRSEARVTVERDKVQSILESMSEGVIFVDANDRFALANRAAERLRKVHREDLIGRPLLEMHTPAARPRIQAMLDDFRAGRKTHVQDILEMADTTLLIRHSAVFDAQGNYIGLVQVSQDLSEKMKREKEIGFLKEYNENLINNLGAGIDVVNAQYEIEFVNKPFADRLGGSDVVGRKCYEVFRGYSRPCAQCPAMQAIRTGARIVSTHTAKDGRLYELVSMPLRNLDGSISAIEMSRDITKRKMLEEQLSQSAKMAALGELSAMLAHQVNNPMGIILSRIECLVLEAQDKGISEETLKDLKVIASHAERVAKTARSLLAFARRSPGERAPLDINAVVNEALVLVENRLTKGGLRLEKRLSPGLPKIMANANQLEQVMLNIINNACDAMPQGGQLAVASTLTSDRPAQICIEISDTGIGIPKKNLKKIFDPFFTTKESGWGTGLGLSVSYGIVRDHQGWIDVESEVNVGSTFKVFLPVADGSTATRPRMPALQR